MPRIERRVFKALEKLRPSNTTYEERNFATCKGEEGTKGISDIYSDKHTYTMGPNPLCVCARGRVVEPKSLGDTQGIIKPLGLPGGSRPTALPLAHTHRGG